MACRIIASIAVYTAYTWRRGHAPLSLRSAYAYVKPVVVALLGLRLIGEPLTRDILVGLAVVADIVALVVSGQRRAV